LKGKHLQILRNEVPSDERTKKPQGRSGGRIEESTPRFRVNNDKVGIAKFAKNDKKGGERGSRGSRHGERNS